MKEESRKKFYSYTTPKGLQIGKHSGIGKTLGTSSKTREIGKEVEQLTYERWMVVLAERNQET